MFVNFCGTKVHMSQHEVVRLFPTIKFEIRKPAISQNLSGEKRFIEFEFD